MRLLEGLITEQTTLERAVGTTGGVFNSKNMGFSVVDRNGLHLDENNKKSVASVFKNLSPVLMPLSVQGSRTEAPKSPTDLLSHLKSTNNGVMLMCLFALATGHSSVDSFTAAMKNTSINTNNSIVAIGREAGTVESWSLIAHRMAREAEH